MKNILKRFSQFNLKKLFTAVFFIVILVLLLATVRGQVGTPNTNELNTSKWTTNGPFELSPERGRFALLYSFVENKSLIFSLPIARFATPDLGIANGNYVSLFAPLVSFAMIPGYILGKMIGLSQVGTYFTVTLFAVFNAILIRQIAIKLGAKNFAANIASLIFVFASPAFAYGVTLYQHHISTFLILSSLYIILRWKGLRPLPVIWLLFALSIPVDYPNLVLMLPIALFASTRILWLQKDKKGIKINIKLLGLLTFITVILPFMFYVWFSQNSYGKPLQLSGTIQGVRAIDVNGKPTKPSLIIDRSIKEVINIPPKKERNAIALFHTRNILNGFYIYFLSPDRSILFFTPVMFLGIFGFIKLWKTRQKELALISGVIGANFVLYSMWYDPWGGWAFGSRYLIPSYALISILIAVALTTFGKKFIFTFLFLIIAVYSIAVNTLGALTTNANPPQLEVLALEKQSGKQEKYTFVRNWDYLNIKGSKSFVYNTYFKNFLSPVQYYWLLVSIITIILSSNLLYEYFNRKNI